MAYDRRLEKRMHLPFKISANESHALGSLSPGKKKKRIILECKRNNFSCEQSI
jgi:hypothetical protein